MIISPTGLLRFLLHAILPVHCAQCTQSLWDDPIPFFCRACWKTITPFDGPRCPRCSRPFSSPIALRHSPFHQCGPCRDKPPAYTKAWGLYPYQSPLKEAIHLFKYHGKVSLARPLATLMCQAFLHPPNIDYIIPIPLHPHRLREREYNQSLLLADPISRHLKTPVLCHTLVRTRPTPPQTTLSRSTRLKNLRHAFHINYPSRIDGQRILLIDDVLTTGTTVNECAKVLRKFGAADVYVSTLARMV
ncbi:MAG: ComF family protein [Nitrospirales bacterium]|nr:ComF family protein [Nitrospirales bacterium]